MSFLTEVSVLITEYELVKKNVHPKYKFVKGFHAVNDTDRRSFLKYYNRFKLSGKTTDLLPQKRGPKWKSRRPLQFKEQKVIYLLEKGNKLYFKTETKEINPVYFRYLLISE